MEVVDESGGVVELGSIGGDAPAPLTVPMRSTLLIPTTQTMPRSSRSVQLSSVG